MSDSIEGGARVAAVTVAESRVVTSGELRFCVGSGPPLQVEISRSGSGGSQSPSFLKLEADLLKDLKGGLRARIACDASSGSDGTETPGGLLGTLAGLLSSAGLPLGPGVRFSLDADPTCDNLYHLPRQSKEPEPRDPSG